MTDLKPCPFCSGEALMESTITDASVRCRRCKAKIVYLHGPIDYGTLAKAVDRWNTRAIVTHDQSAALAVLLEEAEEKGFRAGRS